MEIYTRSSRFGSSSQFWSEAGLVLAQYAWKTYSLVCGLRQAYRPRCVQSLSLYQQEETDVVDRPLPVKEIGSALINEIG
jgi:hypothetical protein